VDNFFIDEDIDGKRSMARRQIVFGMNRVTIKFRQPIVKKHEVNY